MNDVLGLYSLIAAAFNMCLPDSTPVYQIMDLAAKAEKRINDRIKAASEGKTFIG